MTAEPSSDTATALEFPGIHSAASRLSGRGRRLFLGATLTELLILSVAAALAVTIAALSDDSQSALSGRAMAVLFIVVVIVQRYVALRRPERSWFDGRVVAESVKTTAWRYSVAGAPFPAGLSEEESDRLFVDRIRRILDSIAELPLSVSGTDDQITPSMRTLRAAPLDKRRQTYEEHRIRPQQAWYATKAAWNERRYRLLGFGSLLLELIGIGVGLWLVLGEWHGAEAWIGSITTIAAGIAAWSHTRQHSALAASYGRAALELSSIRSLAAHARSEEQWAAFVDDAEAAISREHTAWQARRVA